MAYQTIEYEYSSYLDEDFRQHWDRPFIEVDLTFDGNTEKVQAMIDSGCSTTHVNADIAKLLGLDLVVCQEIEVGGITGATKGYQTEMLSMEITGHGSPFVTPTIFVQELPFPVLLGQDNFFEKFEIKFNRAKRKFSLKRVKQ